MDVDGLVRVLGRRPVQVTLADHILVPIDLQHAVDDHELEIVLHAHGAGVVTLDPRVSHAFIPDSLEIYPARMPHRQQMRKGGEDHYFRIASSPAIDALLTDWVYVPTGDPVLEQDVRWLARSGPANALSTSEHLERDLRATAVCLRLLRHPSRERVASLPETTPARLAAQARRLIYERAARIQHLDEVASALDISPDHLRHEFKRTYGHTLVRELMEARVALVERELADTGDTIAAIASRCGFQSEGYLCRVFRQLRGMAPSAVRSRKIPSRLES